MPWAVLFLPCHIIELMNLFTKSEPKTVSPSVPRFEICPFRGICFSSQLSGLSFQPLDNNQRPTAIWVFSLHTWSGSAYDWLRPRHRACHELRDNGLPADPSH